MKRDIKFLSTTNCCLIIVVVLFMLTGCDKLKTKKTIGTCLGDAIQFYAEGGSTFEDSSCSVDTGRNNDGGIWIHASDIYNGYERTMYVYMPSEWLDIKNPGYQTIAKEYVSFMGCFEEQPEPKNQNPLQKQAPVDNGCSQIGLTINGVPGVRYKNEKFAPHFTFEALQKQ